MVRSIACSAGSTYSVDTQNGFTLISLNFDLSQTHYDPRQPISPVSDSAKTGMMPVYTDNVENSGFQNHHLFIENAAHLRVYAEQIAEDFSGMDQFALESSSARLKLLLTMMHASGPESIPDKIVYIKNYIQKNYAMSQNLRLSRRLD